MPHDFVHLHNHTHYSLLDGLQKIGPMLERTKELGMDSIAITDHGTLSGALSFYKEANKANIRPIIGIETYVAARSNKDKDPQKDKANYHLILLAMNNTGYQNLMRLSTMAHLEGYYYKPRIDHELLEKYNEGLIVLSGCIGGEVGEAVRNNQMAEAEKIISWYKKIFGDRYYIEIQDHGYMWKEQDEVNKKLIKLAKKLHIECVVTADAHYVKHEDQQAHEVLLCVQTGSFLSDKKRMSLTGTNLFLTDPKDIISRWSEHPEFITNTSKIAERCSVDIAFGNILIPRFDVPEGENEKSFLHKMVWQGLLWRYAKNDNFVENIYKLPDSEQDAVDWFKGTKAIDAKKSLPKDIVARAEYELGVIDQMGFNGYFLIVQDFINWGKGKQIIFGPGRGSAAGSIISYSLRITELDPLKYDLLFERFLNPDRISMPDIDIDIQDSRRDEVIKYCVDKYGEDRVAHIVTFGTMAARNAIRDVARVLEVPYADADKLAKMVPPPVQGRHIPLADSIKNDRQLAEAYESPINKKVIDLAVKLEGTIRSHGVHAAGVVIAPDEIVKYVPLEMAQKGVVATQYAMGPVEDIGLLKMDFLGLSNLTIINNAIKVIKRVYGHKIDIESLPLDDEKTFQLLCNADTTGVFQLESDGMKRVLKKLKPSVFEDIVAAVAMYRPGPMQFIDEFIERKHGRMEIEYLHPKMEPALVTTYGVLLYQEQVMEIAKDLCGFSGGQADTLRKAVGKKIASLLATVKKDFIEGGIVNGGADPKTMEKLWKQLEDFADYCFNKSHAACYGLIAYWTGYLKAHFPAAFMAALMTNDFDNIDRLYIDINESRHLGIEVLPPDINESHSDFTVVKETDKERIRYGMIAIKNIGSGVVEEIVNNRSQHGNFISVEDFARRVNPKIVNKKAWESLIKSGAFDGLDSRRGTLLSSLELIVGFSQKLHKQSLSGQLDIFGNNTEPSLQSRIEFVVSEEVTPKQKLQWERDLLGIYLSSHPLDSFREYLNKNVTPLADIKAIEEDQAVVVGGLTTAVKHVVTRRGAKMAFIKLEDATGEAEVIVFPKTFSQIEEQLLVDSVVVINATLDANSNTSESDVKLILQTIDVLGDRHASVDTQNNKTEQKEKILYVQLTDPDNEEKLVNLKKTCISSPGDTDVILVIDRVSRQAIRLPFKVNPTNIVLEKLRDMYGESAVVLK